MYSCFGLVVKSNLQVRIFNTFVVYINKITEITGNIPASSVLKPTNISLGPNTLFSICNIHLLTGAYVHDIPFKRMSEQGHEQVQRVRRISTYYRKSAVKLINNP